MRAYALVYALLVMLMIALSSSGLLMMAHLNGKITNMDNQILYREQLLSDGMRLFLNIESNYGYEEEIPINLYQNENSKLVFLKKKWGLYDILIIQIEDEVQKSKIALIGKENPKELDLSIYLSDKHRPLILAGNTIINGNVRLPEYGVQQGFLDGNSYINKRLINGTIRNSNNYLPKIDFNRIRNMYNLTFDNIEYKIASNIIEHSFKEPTKVIMLEESSTLQNLELKGNILLLCKQPLRIKNNTKIEDCIIVAPTVEIENGTSGNMQIFATDTVWVGNNVTLKYPSVICVSRNDDSTLIHIGEHTKFYGELYSIHSIQNNIGYNSNFETQTNSRLTGFCYIQGNTTLKGSIYGTIFTNYFIYKTLQSTYVNYLYNTTVDIDKRNNFFLFSNVMANPISKSKIIQWKN